MQEVDPVELAVDRQRLAQAAGATAKIGRTRGAAASATSPRLRGEIGSRSDPGEGASPPAERMESPPHPDPLPASGEREQAALYRLMAWLSPAYPVGAFSYSGGIERAVEGGDIIDAASLKRWLATLR